MAYEAIKPRHLENFQRQSTTDLNGSGDVHARVLAEQRREIRPDLG